MTDETWKLDVLDKGFIRLVECMGDDLSISRAARVSYDADWRAGSDKGSDDRLINYLWENKHTSPFEAVTVTFEVQAPIFVFRQWHRHRTQSINELSARYAELDLGWYVPNPELIGLQSANNKQARDMVLNSAGEEVATLINYQNDQAYKTYKKLLELDCPRELARSVLPVGSYSRMFVTANLLNWFRFLGLRLDSHSQYEIRVYAMALLELLEGIAPVAVRAFKKEL